MLLSETIGQGEASLIMEKRQRMQERWEKSTLLNGLDGHIKDVITQLYENQAGWMAENKLILSESTISTSSGSFETIAFPLVRRVFSKLLVNEIVSVQAMNMPYGKLYYLNPKISKRYDDADFAGQQQRHYAPDGGYSNAARDRALGNPLTQFEEKSLADAYYATLYDEFGDALFDRTKGRFEVVTGAVTYDALKYQVGTDKTIVGVMGGFNVSESGKLIGPSGTNMDTESFLASLRIFPTVDLVTSAGYEEYGKTTGDTVSFHVQVPKWGTQIVDSSGNLTLELDLSYPEADYVPLSGATTGVTFVYAYNKYANLEQDSEMAEVTIQLDSVYVAVESRKLRAQWTPELARDIQAFQNIDIEAELTALLSETIASEIDQEVVRDLRSAAAWYTKWDYAGLKKQSGTFYGTQKDWNQTLITKINQVNAQIHKSTLRGGANWLIISPEVSAVFNDLEYFHVSNAAADQDKYNMGIYKAGTLSGTYTVYVHPYMPANTILIGRKGNSILDTGYIYAPYVPLELTPVLTNYKDFTNVRGIMTRVAKKIVNPRFYGRIVVDGLQTFGIGNLR